jgi:hypothetical protein
MLQSPSRKPVYSPEPILERQPHVNLVLEWCPCRPKLRISRHYFPATEEHNIGRLCYVFGISIEPPAHSLGLVRVHDHTLDLVPKIHVFH